MKKLLVVLLCLGLYGCGTAMEAAIKVNQTQARAKTINEKMLNLKLGMTKNEVLNLLGSPDRTEGYTNCSFFIYRTKGRTDYYDNDADDNFAPLCFNEDEKLIGWGRNFYATMEENIKADINLKVKN